MSTVQEVALADIVPSQTESQRQRRESFDEDALAELAESIQRTGLVNPIVVRPRYVDDGLRPSGYEIVAGERRWLAAQRANLTHITASVRNLTDKQVLEVQLIENLQREDLHEMHEAESYEELQKRYGHSVEEIAASVRKSTSYVYGRMKLLALSPKCRAAFYAKEITASIAEKLARIPAKMQDEALPEITGKAHWTKRPMTYREAVEHIHDNYMLDLAEAPFPTDDPDLNGAGPCGSCPKRAANSPGLFNDIKKGDTCTDAVCYQAKVRAFGQRAAELAKRNGIEVIKGKQAKELAPNGATGDRSLRGGYHTLQDKVWDGNNYVPVSKMLQDGETPKLLIDPKSGEAVKVVHDSQLEKPKRRAAASSSESAARKKVELENKFRRALYAALRPKLERPDDHALARAAYNALDAELQKLVWQIREVEIAKSKHGVFDRDKHDGMIGQLHGEELVSFMNDCIYAPTLRANAWAGEKNAARLLTAAQLHGVDTSAIRRAIAPKKKAGAKKKVGSKKGATR